jgi:hypothetical protein
MSSPCSRRRRRTRSNGCARRDDHGRNGIFCDEQHDVCMTRCLSRARRVAGRRTLWLRNPLLSCRTASSRQRGPTGRQDRDRSTFGRLVQPGPAGAVEALCLGGRWWRGSDGIPRSRGLGPPAREHRARAELFAKRNSRENPDPSEDSGDAPRPVAAWTRRSADARRMASSADCPPSTTPATPASPRHPCEQFLPSSPRAPGGVRFQRGGRELGVSLAWVSSVVDSLL